MVVVEHLVRQELVVHQELRELVVHQELRELAELQVFLVFQVVKTTSSITP
jgi:hypothetical protein